MKGKIGTSIILTASLLVGSFVISMAANTTTGIGRKRGANPAPTPSPGAKRPKPIQSPRPKAGMLR